MKINLNVLSHKELITLYNDILQVHDNACLDFKKILSIDDILTDNEFELLKLFKNFSVEKQQMIVERLREIA